MKVTLTYETQVNYVIDLDTEKVESITVVKQNGSHQTGYEGFIHARSDTNPFYRSNVKQAVAILKTKPQPKWQVKEVDSSSVRELDSFTLEYVALYLEREAPDWKGLVCDGQGCLKRLAGEIRSKKGIIVHG